MIVASPIGNGCADSSGINAIMVAIPGRPDPVGRPLCNRRNATDVCLG